jgi:hypothetical protein
MANLKSLSLKAAIALVAPMLLAQASTGPTFNFGAEVGANIHDVSWGSTVKGTTLVAGTVNGAIPSTMSSLLHTSRFSLTEGHDEGVYYTLSGAVFAKTTLTEDIRIMARIGYDFSGEDGIAMKSVTMTASPTGAHGGFNTKGTLTLDSAISPALFVGYESLYFGVLYQMNTYKVTASDAFNGIDLDIALVDVSADTNDKTSVLSVSSGADKIGKPIKAADLEENQMLFGFKALHPQEFGEFSVTLSAEAFTNLGADTEDDMVDHWKNLVSQLPSYVYDGATASGGSADEEILIAASGDKQIAANTFYYRMGISAAIEFASL